MTTGSIRPLSVPHLLLSLAVTGPAPPASATVWKVEPDGTGDVPTIQDALDAAAHGDEILLGDGTFTGAGNQNLLYQGKDVTIRSASGMPSLCVLELTNGLGPAVTLTSADDADAVLRDVTIRADTQDPMLETAGSPTIDNVAFDGAYRRAVLSTAGAPTITNCSFRDGNTPALESRGTDLTMSDCLFEANAMIGSMGPLLLKQETDAVLTRCTFRNNIKVDHSLAPVISAVGGSATFADCVIEDNPGYAMFLNGTSTGANFVLEGCEIRGNSHGAYTYTPSTTNLTPLVVRDCRFLDNAQALDINGAFDVLLEDLVFDGNETAANIAGRNGVGTLVARHVSITNDTGYGIASTMQSVELDGCEVRGCRLTGLVFNVYAGALTDLVVRNCLVTGNRRDGVVLRGWDSALIEHSTIASNGSISGDVGLAVENGSIVQVTSTILRNNCAPGGVDASVDGGTLVDFACCVIDPSSFTGEGQIVLQTVINEDPLFCDPVACADLPSSGGLYTLQAGSPALQPPPCGTIGAFGAGCATPTGVATSLQPSSWARVKAAYR